MRLIFLFLCFAYLFSCGNNSTDASNSKDESSNTSVTKEETVSTQPVELMVYINNLRLRDGAGIDAKDIAQLDENTTLIYEGEVTDYTTEIKLRGTQMNAPWIKVKRKDGLSGWVYAGGVKSLNDEFEAAIRTLDDIRLESFFGKNVVREMKSYRANWEALQTSSDFAKLYEEATAIQDTVNSIIGEKIQVEDPSKAIDLSWLERTLPGFQISFAAEGTIFYLFKDFKKMHPKVLATSGTEDDAFIDFQFRVNEVDSIEYFYKSWFMQTWDYGGHSLLGQGKHLELLQLIDEQLTKSKIFEKPLLKTKQEILNDVLDQHVTYWESKAKILDELRNIIKADFVFFSKADKVALSTRLEIFKNPKANKIEMNRRSF